MFAQSRPNDGTLELYISPPSCLPALSYAHDPTSLSLKKVRRIPTFNLSALRFGKARVSSRPRPPATPRPTPPPSLLNLGSLGYYSPSSPTGFRRHARVQPTPTPPPQMINDLTHGHMVRCDRSVSLREAGGRMTLRHILPHIYMHFCELRVRRVQPILRPSISTFTSHCTTCRTARRCPGSA